LLALLGDHPILQVSRIRVKTPMVSLLLCGCVGWFSYVRFLPRIAILLESADIWRVEATSEKNAIGEFT